MTTPRRVQAFVLALAAAPSLAGAALTVEHAPVACVPAERYARIAARGVPAAEAVRGEVQFRGRAEDPWYAVAMARDGEAWVALLPRPAASTARFEYRVVLAGRGTPSGPAKLEEVEQAVSGPHAVRVTGPAEECATEAPSSVQAPIVVAVPSGAPLVPPVPAGFSPAGAVAAKGPPAKHTGLKIAGAAAALAVGAAVATGTAASTGTAPLPQPAAVPPLRFNGTIPVPGTVINPNTDQALVILLLMASEPPIPLNLVWQADLYDGNGNRCLYMLGVLSAVQRPLGLALTSPLISTGVCPRQVDIVQVRTRVTYQDQLVFDEAVGLPFFIRP